MKGIAAFLLISLGASPVLAIEAKDASYFCAGEAAGGLILDKPTGKWKSANFRPESKFVLKLKFLRSSQEKLYPSATGLDTVNYFKVTLTASGTNSEAECFNTRNYKDPITVWGADGYLQCNSSLTEYKFNPANNRFLSAYLIGYIDGDDVTDTPAVTAGTCTKIN